MSGPQLVALVLLGIWIGCPRQRSSGRHDRRYRARLSEEATRESAEYRAAGRRHANGRTRLTPSDASVASSENRVYQLVRQQPSPGPGSPSVAGATPFNGEAACGK